ncbi:MAG: hypothetical protein RLN69_15000, partial [Woeseiaceae bacterium]
MTAIPGLQNRQDASLDVNALSFAFRFRNTSSCCHRRNPGQLLPSCRVLTQMSAFADIVASLCYQRFINDTLPPCGV